MDSADSRLVGFKRHLRVQTVPAEAVYLISERGVTALSGSGIEKVAPLLDGTRNVAQLTREVSAELAAAEVGTLLGQLAEADLLDLRRPASPGPAEPSHPAGAAHPAGRAGPAGPGPDGEPRTAAAAAFWSLAGLDADQVARTLDAATVEIVTLGQDDSLAAVMAICAESGLAGRPEGTGPADMSLVLCEDYLDPRLQAVNARHLASGRPWLLAKPSGVRAWIGPVFQPGATRTKSGARAESGAESGARAEAGAGAESGACWACLAKRLEENRDETYLLRRILGAQAFPAAPRAALPAARAAALQLTVLEAVKWLAGCREAGQQSIYVLDTLTLRGRHHRVRRRPQCACCGEPALVAVRDRRPPALAARGQHEPSGPGQVLADYGHLIDPVTGIVPELRRDTRCGDLQHAYVSGRNRAMAASTVAGIKASSRHPSGGKGVTESEARAGALCEAVERYCGTRQGDEATVRGSLRSLGAQAMDPGSCLLFDQRQFQGRARWNATCAPFHWVPEPFDDTAVMDWTPLWSLLTGEQRLLPTAMLYYHPATDPGPACVLADSNGNAAGASLPDAIRRGFLELVERDAIALWWYNRTRQPEVCLESFEDPWISGLPERYRRLGREIWVLDTTSDLGIPVMAALSRRTGQRAEDIMFGFGAHPDPRLAVRRALTELGQVLPPGDSAQEGYGRADPRLAAWWAEATVASQPYLLPAPDQPARAAADYPPAVRHGPDLDQIRAIAGRAGVDVLVLDQTRPDIKMPVVKVVAPGLRHFWPRFAPGRLFDVPVRLGRLTRPTEYCALNPNPLYV